ncbi:prepilin-type cleavage/methylation domain-containing protein [Bdellovibrio bacteriovorus]|uniref:prepilin-type cleavage/methylation domain-containing protein n=1 Tax=Bdellovibrio bacteriovorus TaxID=959 RepID=UPI0035A6194F
MYSPPKTKKEITNEIEDKVDNILAERMILRDLKYSEPSFNNVIITDDNGRAFFDYVADVTQSSVDNAPRKLTLEAGRRNEFIFIATNEKMGGSMMYAPSNAYQVGTPPGDPFVAATLTFVSLNKDNIVQFSDPQGLGRYWQAGNVLMLDTPTMVRQMTASGPDYSKPARSPIFLGTVQSPGPTRLIALNIPGFINTTNPMYPSETIGDEDKFLRDIPPMGGAAPLVRLKVVSIIKYYLQKDTKGNRSMFIGRCTPVGSLALDSSSHRMLRKWSFPERVHTML